MTAQKSTTPAAHEAAGSGEGIGFNDYALQVAANLSSRIDTLDYDLSAPEEWGTLEGGVYDVGSVSPAEVSASISTPHAGVRFPGGTLEGEQADVWYQESGLFLSIEASEGEARASVAAELSPEEARELAYSLLLAAEEYELYPRSDNG